MMVESIGQTVVISNLNFTVEDITTSDDYALYQQPPLLIQRAGYLKPILKKGVP